MLRTETRPLSLAVFEPARKGWQGRLVANAATQSHQHPSQFRLSPYMNPIHRTAQAPSNLSSAPFTNPPIYIYVDNGWRDLAHKRDEGGQRGRPYSWLGTRSTVSECTTSFPVRVRFNEANRLCDSCATPHRLSAGDCVVKLAA